ncbi:hypothetical protein OUZ56_027523 [Daphnia magna]|uniref:Uncharacterized protein n=1 Tax=Daphnia magna TaxID=35525 RepID=A0ABQ9ZPZ8_9CRUS|nr:hypothetical protein OUZ56_027523 [Daphnia magna]
MVQRSQATIATSEEERLFLEELSSHNQYVTTLLPIRTVGVQIRNLDVFVIMPRSVLVIIANGSSRIPTTMALAALRLPQKANASVATSVGRQHQILKVAVINRSHVGLASEVPISSLKNRALEEVDVFLNYDHSMNHVFTPRYPMMRNPCNVMYSNNTMSP